MKKSLLITMLAAMLTAVMILAACSDDEQGVAYEEVNETLVSFEVIIYESVEELAEVSTHIIRGEVIDKRTELQNTLMPREIAERELAEEGLSPEEIEAELEFFTFEREPEIVTFYTIRVLEVFQEKYELDEIIEVSTLGGQHENDRVIVDGAGEMEVGSEFILFLYSYSDYGVAELPDYVLVSHLQGLYYVPREVEGEESIVDFDGQEIKLESTARDEFFTITIDDLIEIAEENDLLE